MHGRRLAVRSAVALGGKFRPPQVGIRVFVLLGGAAVEEELAFGGKGAGFRRQHGTRGARAAKCDERGALVELQAAMDRNIDVSRKKGGVPPPKPTIPVWGTQK